MIRFDFTVGAGQPREPLTWRNPKDDGANSMLDLVFTIWYRCYILSGGAGLWCGQMAYLPVLTKRPSAAAC